MCGVLTWAGASESGAGQFFGYSAGAMGLTIGITSAYALLWPKGGLLVVVSDGERDELAVPSWWAIRPLLVLTLLLAIAYGVAEVIMSDWGESDDSGFYSGMGIVVSIGAAVALCTFISRGAEPSRFILNSDFLEFRSPTGDILIEWRDLESVRLVAQPRVRIEIRHPDRVEVMPGPFASDPRLIVDLLCAVKQRPEVLDDLETRDVESTLLAVLEEAHDRDAASTRQSHDQSAAWTGSGIPEPARPHTQVIRAEPMTPEVTLGPDSRLWIMGLLGLPLAGIVALMWVGFEHPGPERVESYAVGLALLLGVVGHGYMRVRRRPGCLRIRVGGLWEDVRVTDSRVLRPLAWMVAASYAIAVIACWIRVDESIQLGGPIALWMPLIAALLAAPSTWSFIPTTLERSYISINPYFLGVAVAFKHESIRWEDLRSVELVADRGLRIRMDHGRVLNVEVAPFASDPRLIVDLLRAVKDRPEVIEDLETFDIGSLLNRT